MPSDLVELVEHPQQAGADEAVARVGQDVRHDRPVRRLEGGRERLGHEEQEEQQPDGRAVDGEQGDQRDDDPARQVAGEHDDLARHPVGERTEQRGPEHGRDEAHDEREHRQERAVGAAQHQRRQRHPRHVVAELAGDLGDDQPAELAVAQDVAVRRAESRRRSSPVEHPVHHRPGPPGRATVVVDQRSCCARRVAQDLRHARELAHIAREAVGRLPADEQDGVAHPGRGAPCRRERPRLLGVEQPGLRRRAERLEGASGPQRRERPRRAAAAAAGPSTRRRPARRVPAWCAGRGPRRGAAARPRPCALSRRISRTDDSSSPASG